MVKTKLSNEEFDRIREQLQANKPVGKINIKVIKNKSKRKRRTISRNEAQRQEEKRLRKVTLLCPSNFNYK